jgi:lambda family phage portal protein
MRARARWLHENNPIMANIDKAIINNVIGRGITLQAKTGDKKLDAEIEARFSKWMRNCDISGRKNFADVQRILLETRMVDGEVYIYKRITKDGLKIQIIEADAIDSNKGKSGITIDDTGAAVIYHFSIGGKSYDLPAKDIINYARFERASQLRGISEYKQAIIDIKNFSAFNTATIQAARARANISYIVESNRENVAHGATTEDGEEIFDINGLMVYYLREGESIKSLDSTNGGTNYKEFIGSVVRMMAVARNISYELAFRDYSQVNFASARASLIQDNKRFDYEQEHLTSYVLESIFESWLEFEQLQGLRIPSSMPEVYHRWAYPKRDWVDPLKDLKALQVELDIGLTTRTDACASRGVDYEENLETIAKEKELRAKYGITIEEDLIIEE